MERYSNPYLLVESGFVPAGAGFFTGPIVNTTFSRIRKASSTSSSLSTAMTSPSSSMYESLTSSDKLKLNSNFALSVNMLKLTLSLEPDSNSMDTLRVSSWSIQKEKDDVSTAQAEAHSRVNKNPQVPIARIYYSHFSFNGIAI